MKTLRQATQAYAAGHATTSEPDGVDPASSGGQPGNGSIAGVIQELPAALQHLREVV